MQRKSAAAREKEIKFSKVRKQSVLGSNPEQCYNIRKFMTMEKPVGFLKLEMYVVLEMKILSSGFAQLERD